MTASKGLESEHFKYHELCCRGRDCCEHSNYVTQDLLDLLERIRTAASNRPVHVDCAYRCRTHNAMIGGAERSQHIYGRAADIKIPGLEPEEIEEIARRCGAVGIGRNDILKFVHVDMRLGQPAQWCYGKDGHERAYYPPPASQLSKGEISHNG